jgi:hypothetical protein
MVIWLLLTKLLLLSFIFDVPQADQKVSKNDRTPPKAASIFVATAESWLGDYVV